MYNIYYIIYYMCNTCIHTHTHIYLVVVGGGGAVSVYVVHVLLRDLARLQARLRKLEKKIRKTYKMKIK